MAEAYELNYINFHGYNGCYNIFGMPFIQSGAHVGGEQLSCIVIIKSLLRNSNADVLCLVMIRSSFGTIDTRQYLGHISTERPQMQHPVPVGKVPVCLDIKARPSDLSSPKKTSPYVVGLIQQSPTCRCVC